MAWVGYVIVLLAHKPSVYSMYAVLVILVFLVGMSDIYERYI